MRRVTTPELGGLGPVGPFTRSPGASGAEFTRLLLATREPRLRMLPVSSCWVISVRGVYSPIPRTLGGRCAMSAVTGVPIPAHAMMRSGTSLNVDVVNTAESEHSAESVVRVEGEEAMAKVKVMMKDC